MRKAMVKKKPCKDCVAEGITSHRPTPYPGPRCATHFFKTRKARRLHTHDRNVEIDFGISGEEYWKLYRSQGGRCAICQIATGAARALAVDHDHTCEAGHPPNLGCRHCVRALLCHPCNQLIGRLNVEALQRAIGVLTDPPAQRVLEGDQIGA
jgi:hypothetical protein